MAKYVIQHACGHKSKVNLFGKRSERQIYLADRAKQKCPKCCEERWLSEDLKREIQAAQGRGMM